MEKVKANRSTLQA